VAKQSNEQKKIVGRVMHEFRHGELESQSGEKVRNPRQAIAIGLSEAGASNQESPVQNKRALSRSKNKERHGQTARQEKEGRTATGRHEPASRPKRSGARVTSTDSQATRADLYAQAKRKGIPGRSHMSKGQLERALSA
jgi:hypothetical protein